MEVHAVQASGMNIYCQHHRDQRDQKRQKEAQHIPAKDRLRDPVKRRDLLHLTKCLCRSDIQFLRIAGKIRDHDHIDHKHGKGQESRCELTEFGCFSKERNKRTDKKRYKERERRNEEHDQHRSQKECRGTGATQADDSCTRQDHDRRAEHIEKIHTEKLGHNDARLRDRHRKKHIGIT